ncbi:hypothetical protein [Paraburkholderia bannensis]|uniref:hypothetical protein n=1 Tax=Paraburkholderia bannensis TaxID=765414 RepID=UPI002AB6EA46|nr:hypothetical protein [Paraburkholderia bannensis]
MSGAATDPAPGPQAASDIVARTTKATIASDGSNRRFCMCAFIPMIGSAHSFYGLEERIVKRVKTFADDDFSFANVFKAKKMSGIVGVETVSITNCFEFSQAKAQYRLIESYLKK